MTGERSDASSDSNQLDSMSQEAVVFDCVGDELCGVLHRSVTDALTGVVVVVGGRQYRVGAHRQFVELGRHLSEQGFPVLRFDVRGMGDSSGSQRDFLDIIDDISSAVTLLLQKVPSLKRVVLWGLCDGATAALLHTVQDKRISSLVLVNPWISTESGQARTVVRHYYAGRLRERAFWKSLLSGKVQLRSAFLEFLQTVTQAKRSKPDDIVEEQKSLPELVFRTLTDSVCDVLIVLSSDDLTAREFDDEYQTRLSNKPQKSSNTIKIERMQADHTFSSSDAQNQLFSLTVEFLRTTATKAATNLK